MAQFTVHGKLAVITGAADGIGKALAIKLAFEGCNVALVDIEERKVKDVAMYLNGLFPRQTIHAFKCNVTDIVAFQALVEKIKSSFNTQSIQFLFNNVGVAGLVPTIKADIKQLKNELDINLWSAVYGTRLFLPMLLANHPQEQCFIVNTGSIASIETGFCWYSVTKHALIAYSETLRDELHRFHPKHNILVTTLVPAFVETDIRQNSALQLRQNEQWKDLKHRWSESKLGQMIDSTSIKVNVLANVVFEGLRNKEEVIPSHLDWHTAAIQDRMHALLHCTNDNKANIKKAIKSTMAKSASLKSRAKL